MLTFPAITSCLARYPESTISREATGSNFAGDTETPGNSFVLSHVCLVPRPQAITQKQGNDRGIKANYDGKVGFS